MRARRSKFGRNPRGLSVFIKTEISHLFQNRITGNLNLTFIVKKELCNLGKDLVIMFCYVPPEGNAYYEDLDEENGITLLTAEIEELHTKHNNCLMMIMGDLNARTGNKQDFIWQDSIKHIVQTTDWYEADDFQKIRNSMDTEINRFGTTLVDTCKIFGLHMLNGRIGEDTQGNFTYISERGKSLIDYVILSAHLHNIVDTFKVDTELTLSDHLPLITEIKFENQAIHQETEGQKWVKYKPPQNTEGRNRYRQALTSEDCQRKLAESAHWLLQSDINNAVNSVTEAIQLAAVEFATQFPANLNIRKQQHRHRIGKLKKGETR